MEGRAATETDIMHRGIVFAATLTALAPIASATQARADEWCGYSAKDNAVIECGYTTAQDCETAVDTGGKVGVCFVDPDNALNTKQATPIVKSKVSAQG
jgi:hypothetical protein